MEGFIGEIRLFAGNFAPRSWAFCEGQLLPISQNTALFSILGTIYGGDGRTTFALPDLRGRVAVHAGRGPGLSDYRLGQRGGSENNTLNTTQLPAHTHAATGTVKANNSAPDESNPTGAFPATLNNGTEGYAESSSGYMANNAVSGTLGNTGNNQAVNNMQPWLAEYFIICLQGTFPSRS